VSGLKVYGIDRTNGLTQWSMDTPGTLATAVGMDDLRCYMATTKGGIHAYVMPLTKRAFEEKFGKEAAVPGAFNSSDPISNPSSLRTPYPLWNFQTDSQVALPPVLLPTQVVFANQSGVLYSFDRDKNKLGDRFYSASAITAPIGQHGNDMYVASQDYNVYNLELSGARLALRWQTTIHSRILAKPIVAGSDVYVVGVDQGLFCLDRLSGAVKWRQPKAETYLAASKRLVFAADKFNNTMCIDRDKGTILSTWDTRNWAHRLTNEYNDRLYLVNHDGQVVCLHDHDKSYEKPHKHNAPPPPKPEKKPMEEMPMEEKK
jgi:outer membrane protein assembly factor BamB